MRLRPALLCLAFATPAALPGAAFAVPAPRTLAASHAVPAQTAAANRPAWRALFANLRAGRYDASATALSTLPDAPLTAFAQAELLLARGAAPGVTDVPTFVAAHADLPQTSRIASRFHLDGVVAPHISDLFQVGPDAPRARAHQRDIALEAALKPLLATERATDAEAAWTSLSRKASDDAREDWAHQIAWAYYRSGDDIGARRMGLAAAEGASEHAASGAWVAGLSAWRADDCAASAAAFDTVAAKSPSDDLAAASAYWASRAYLACNRPDLVTERLTTAATHPHSFYGLLARRALGLDSGIDWSEPDFIKADWNYLATLPGARRAVAMVEVGQLGLADRELRYLAITADPQAYPAILRLAARLSLPATQLWLSSRSRDGAQTPLSARFPAPDWTPPRGWRVDQALVYAHALQESRFATDVVSRAGARGLLQLMPATAAKVARDMGAGGALNDPAFNIECGQTYMEELRDTSYTAGLLPKVIAAYNAGPGSVEKWNASVRDNGDPLLFIESIPFRETRAYVQTVLRNYWMYELRDGRQPTSMAALAQGLWPKFPGMPGPVAVRMDRTAAVMTAAP